MEYYAKDPGWSSQGCTLEFHGELTVPKPVVTQMGSSIHLLFYCLFICIVVYAGHGTQSLVHSRKALCLLDAPSTALVLLFFACFCVCAWGLVSCFVFQTRSCYVVQVDLELSVTHTSLEFVTLQSLPAKYWDYRHVPLCLARTLIVLRFHR